MVERTAAGKAPAVARKAEVRGLSRAQSREQKSEHRKQDWYFEHCMLLITTSYYDVVNLIIFLCSGPY